MWSMGLNVEYPCSTLISPLALPAYIFDITLLPSLENGDSVDDMPVTVNLLVVRYRWMLFVITSMFALIL